MAPAPSAVAKGVSEGGAQAWFPAPHDHSSCSAPSLLSLVSVESGDTLEAGSDIPEGHRQGLLVSLGIKGDIQQEGLC